MLRKKLGEVQQQTQVGLRGISTNTGTGTGGDTDTGSVLSERKITGVQNDMMICEGNIKAKLFSPLPGLKWKCNGVTGSQGVIMLEKPLTGLILTVDGDSYCLGVSGETSEFEIIIQVGKNELRLNDLYVSLQTGLLIKNGAEEAIR